MVTTLQMITLSANKGRSDVRGSSRKTRLRIATFPVRAQGEKGQIRRTDAGHWRMRQFWIWKSRWSANNLNATKQIFFCAGVTFHLATAAPVQDQCQKGIAPDQLEPRQGLGPERCQILPNARQMPGKHAELRKFSFGVSSRHPFGKWHLDH